MDIIEANDGDIARDMKPRQMCSSQGADRAQIVAANHRGRHLFLSENRIHRVQATVDGKIRRDNRNTVFWHLARLQVIHKSGKAHLGGGQMSRTSYERETPMTQLKKMV